MVKDIQFDLLTKPAFNFIAVGEPSTSLRSTTGSTARNSGPRTAPASAPRWSKTSDREPPTACRIPSRPNRRRTTSNSGEISSSGLTTAPTDGNSGVRTAPNPGPTWSRTSTETQSSSLEFDASFEELNGELFFPWNFGLYKSDGTGPGTVRVPVPPSRSHQYA